MPRIEIKTKINASIEIVFDLSRSIDLHKISTHKTNEEAIKGKTSGLIGLNETVTWRAKHLGVYQTLTTKITAFDRPRLFVDEMEKGIFKSFRHEHHFEEQNGQVLVIDIFDYTSPFGVIGKLADRIFLKEYMRAFLIERNKIIKEFAESARWKEVLNENIY